VCGGKILFPQDKFKEIPAKEEFISEEKQPEARKLWESYEYFLQKLGIFGGLKESPHRDGGLRSEPLPLQLSYNANRRVMQGIQNTPPQRRVPSFKLPTPNPLHLNLSPPIELLQQSSQNSLLHLPPPPPTPPSSLPPPPQRPLALSSHGNISPQKSVHNFPYEYVLPDGLIPPPVNVALPSPVHTPSRVDVSQQTPKPFGVKPLKHKKPVAFEGSHDLVGSFSVSQRPQVLHPVRPRPQHPQQQLISRPRPGQQQSAQEHHFTQGSLPHPRPAPQPHKQHPRPPPQPQLVVIPPKPNAIQKKPIYPDFNPSPQEGSMLADAFQPVFVASPSLDDLDDLDNDLMKPVTFRSARSASSTPRPFMAPSKLENFF
ncbi:hypothetical protein SK128_027658, partial [Halocaridina rubra]